MTEEDTMTAHADIYLIAEKQLHPDERPSEGYARRFFKLTLVSGEVVEVSADHYRLSDTGLLLLAYWMGPDEPEFLFQVHSAYAPGSWLSFTEDEAAHDRWVAELRERTAKVRAQMKEFDASRALGALDPARTPTQ